MEYKEMLAELVRLAIEKGHEPDEVRDDFDGFEMAFKKFFGVSFKTWEEVLVKNGIPAADAPAVLQRIADVLLGNNPYV